MTKVTVTPKKKVVTVNVKVSNTGQVTTTQAPVTVASIASGAKRLDTLLDVDAAHEVEGGVPVYHAANDTYTVEALNIAGGGTVDEIDGGTY